MLVQSETYRPMFKWWSPMSAGSWGLSAFSAFSFASFAGVLAEDGWFGLGRWSPLAATLRRGWIGRAFEVGGAASAFFLGAYTGTLLSATNQPVWAQTSWLSPLFLASSASTGVAAVLLAAVWRFRETSDDALARLERLDGLAMVLELAMLGRRSAVSIRPARRPGRSGPGRAVLIPMLRRAGGPCRAGYASSGLPSALGDGRLGRCLSGLPARAHGPRGGRDARAIHS